MGTQAFECLYPQRSTAIDGYQRSQDYGPEGLNFPTAEPNTETPVAVERLNRTQEVGGSNPPSSIASNALQTGHIEFR
jgi:hypothetical protein